MDGWEGEWPVSSCRGHGTGAPMVLAWSCTSSIVLSAPQRFSPLSHSLFLPHSCLAPGLMVAWFPFLMPLCTLGSLTEWWQRSSLGGPGSPWNAHNVFWGSLKICHGKEELQCRGCRAGEVRYHVLPTLPHLSKSFLCTVLSRLCLFTDT